MPAARKTLGLELRVLVLSAWMLASFGLAQPTDLGLPKTLIAQGDYPAAIARIESLLSKRPQDAEVHFWLARAYYLQGGIDGTLRAEIEIRSAMRLLPGRAEHQWLLGLILDRQGRTDTALASLKAATAIETRAAASDLYRYAMDWATVAWREGDLRQALEAYRRAAGAQPDAFWPWIHQGKILLSLNELEASLTALSHALGVLEVSLKRGSLVVSHPAWVEAHYWRGRAWEALGRLTEARTDYRRALERNPGYAPAKDALERLTSSNR